ncbi:hypothetical protein M3Y99_01823900 [Aphelenchoides fujianensis]|nr:hypothetical protein M3Y99_01823900 [Aphelenchoides fujianensis]
MTTPARLEALPPLGHGGLLPTILSTPSSPLYRRRRRRSERLANGEEVDEEANSESTRSSQEGEERTGATVGAAAAFPFDEFAAPLPKCRTPTSATAGHQFFSAFDPRGITPLPSVASAVVATHTAPISFASSAATSAQTLGTPPLAYSTRFRAPSAHLRRPLSAMAGGIGGAGGGGGMAVQLVQQQPGVPSAHSRRMAARQSSFAIRRRFSASNATGRWSFAALKQPPLTAATGARRNFWHSFEMCTDYKPTACCELLSRGASIHRRRLLLERLKEHEQEQEEKPNGDVRFADVSEPTEATKRNSSSKLIRRRQSGYAISISSWH